MAGSWEGVFRWSCQLYDYQGFITTLFKISATIIKEGVILIHIYIIFLQMFNFREALTYIFKEKDWYLKFGLIFFFQLLFIVPSVLLTLIEPNTSINLNNSKFVYNRGFDSLDFFALIYSLFLFIVAIPYTIVNAWYMYENTQSGIFKRATSAIWKNKFEDTLKKSGKYLITNFLYSIIGLLVLALVIGVLCIIGFGILLLARSMMDSTGVNNNMFLFFTSGTGLILLCLAIVLFTILYFVFYMWMITGSLRLVATNTFSEGLKFQENWRIAWKHKTKFLTLALWLILAGLFFIIVLTIISIPFSMITLAFLKMPAIYVGFQLVAQIITALLTTYLAYFVFPRLLGQLFRRIIKDEESLNYIQVEE